MMVILVIKKGVMARICRAGQIQKYPKPISVWKYPGEGNEIPVAGIVSRCGGYNPTSNKMCDGRHWDVSTHRPCDGIPPGVVELAHRHGKFCLTGFDGQ